MQPLHTQPMRSQYAATQIAENWTGTAPTIYLQKPGSDNLVTDLKYVPNLDVLICVMGHQAWATRCYPLSCRPIIW
jgi:hypothetical protein